MKTKYLSETEYDPSPSRHRQRENEFCPYAFRADDVDMLIVGLDDLFHNGKTKSGAPLVFPAGDVCLVEAFPDFFQAVLRDADTGIFDGNENLSAPLGGLNGDGGICMAELDRIINEIVEHLLDLAHIGGNIQLLAGQDQMEGDFLLKTGSLEGLDRHLDDIVDVKAGNVQHGAVGAVFVQFQHTLGQLIQPFCFQKDNVQILVLQLMRDGSVHDGLDIALDGGQRRAKIMGYVGNELPLILFPRIQLGGHVIQGSRKISQLIACLKIDLGIKITGSIGIGGPGDPADGDVNCPGKNPKNQKRAEDDERKGSIRDIEESVAVARDQRYRLMYQHVTPHFIIDVDGRIYRQGLLIQCMKKRSGLIIAGSEAGDGEIRNFGRRISGGAGIGIDQNPAPRVNEPDGGVQVSVEGRQMLPKLRQSQCVLIIIDTVIGGDGFRLPVEIVCFCFQHIVVSSLCGKGSGCYKGQHSKSDITGQNFQIKCTFHDFTSNKFTSNYFTSNL